MVYTPTCVTVVQYLALAAFHMQELEEEVALQRAPVLSTGGGVDGWRYGEFELLLNSCIPSRSVAWRSDTCFMQCRLAAQHHGPRARCDKGDLDDCLRGCTSLGMAQPSACGIARKDSGERNVVGFKA